MATTQLTVRQLIDAVAQLSPEELARFEQEWDALWLRRMGAVDEEAARLAARYRLSPKQEQRLRELLDRNSEGRLSKAEGQELDSLLKEVDRRTVQVADALARLARQRCSDERRRHASVKR